MVGNRYLIGLGGCVLMASAAWADDVGFIDCRSHPEETPVFAKARQTHEYVASLACGERFTILLNGFIFSRVQTADGKVGYVYSNMITQDHSGAPVAKRAPAPPATSAVAAAAVPQVAPAPVTPAQAEPSQPPVASASVPSTSTVAAVAPSSAARTQPAAVEPAPERAPVATPTVPDTTPAAAQPMLPAPVQAVPAQVPAESAAPVAASVPEAAAPAAQPEAAPAAAQPEAAPGEAAAPAIRPEKARESWERPNAGGVRRVPLIELFGGYGFARTDNGAGTTSNLNGALGSFGWNVKPWLQIVGDTSYNVVTISGTKNVLYGNHYGPRLFHHMRNRWGARLFVEGLVGGSRADTSVSGSSAYSTSVNCTSFKVGGGLDMRPSRHLEIRLLDVDYYRTAFGTNLHQNNYFASAGIVLRLFGGSSE